MFKLTNIIPDTYSYINNYFIKYPVNSMIYTLILWMLILVFVGSYINGKLAGFELNTFGITCKSLNGRFFATDQGNYCIKEKNSIIMYPDGHIDPNYLKTKSSTLP